MFTVYPISSISKVGWRAAHRVRDLRARARVEDGGVVLAEGGVERERLDSVTSSTHFCLDVSK